MNFLPPLEQTDPALAAHFRAIAHGNHIAVKTLIVGKESCPDHIKDAERIYILKNGKAFVVRSEPDNTK